MWRDKANTNNHGLKVSLVTLFKCLIICDILATYFQNLMIHSKVLTLEGWM
jgi:hypothetical protein